MKSWIDMDDYSVISIVIKKRLTIQNLDQNHIMSDC